MNSIRWNAGYARAASAVERVALSRPASPRGSAATHPWLRRPHPNPLAKIRLITFPYAGAGASAYYPWANCLPPTIELGCVQPPGRESRLAEDAFTRIQALVRAAGEALLPYLDRPFVFYGHSLGALVSFELTRILGEQHGITPLHLFVSGHDAPHLASGRRPIYGLPDAAFVDELKRINGTPPEVFAHQDLMDLMLPILRADFEAAETYVYRSSRPVRCPISALGGLEDDFVSAERLKAWGSHTIGGFALHMFPGGHFYLNAHRRLLIEIIVRTLQRYLAVENH